MASALPTATTSTQPWVTAMAISQQAAGDDDSPGAGNAQAAGGNRQPQLVMRSISTSSHWFNPTM